MSGTQSFPCGGPVASEDGAALTDRRLVLDARSAELAAEAAWRRHSADQSLTGRAATLLRPIARLARRLQRSATKRMRRVRAESVTLGADFGLSGATWDAFVARRLKSAGVQAHQTRPAAASEEAPERRRLWLVFTTPPEASGSEDLMAASLVRAQRLREAAPFSVGCLAVGGAVGDLLRHGAGHVDTVPDLAAAFGRPGQDDLVALLRPGDGIRPEFARDAAERRVFDSDLVLVDGAIRRAPADEDRVWPVLHPGLNYLHALNCDHFRSRALVRCGAARAALARGARDARAIVLDVMGRAHARDLAENTDASGGRVTRALHLDLPLLELVDSADRVAAERREMVRTGRPPVFPAPAGASPPAGAVSVVICTKDRGHLLRQLVDRLLALPARRVPEVIVVTNGTTNPYALRTQQQIARAGRITCIEHQGAFNFSAQCNRGAARATGDFILLLNDDTVPVTPDWLDCLLAPFADPNVAIAGPLLLYPDERVQHAGMFLGHRGTGGHALRFARVPEGDYLFLATAPRYVSAVTGAAMLVERGFWEDANGLEIAFANTLQDVDLCMRAADAGRSIVYVPNAILMHMESVSARNSYAEPATAFARRRELELFGQRLARFGRDPFHNAAFDPDEETLRRLAARPHHDYKAYQSANGCVR